jgi:alpha-glucosidase
MREVSKPAGESACSTRICLLLATALFAFAQGDLVSVTSPNGQIEFRLFMLPQEDPGEHPRLAYEVSFRGKPLMDTSYLGLNIRDQPVLGVNLDIVTSKKQSVDETYTVPAGKTKIIRNHYNSLTADYIQNGSLGRKLTMEVRAYDDGVAFRYVIPWSETLNEIWMENDSTQFRFAQDAQTYPLILRDFQTNYEDQYSPMTLSGIHPESLIGLPFLVEQPGVGWVAITEADIDNFPGMYLHHLEGRAMEAVLSPRRDDAMLAATGKPTMTLPWRVLLIGSEPGRLIESNIVVSLNSPSAISDTSWIRPGKAMRNGWSGAPTNTAMVKHFIDFAADSKLQYMLIDKGWAARAEDKLPDDLTKTVAAIDMPETLRYAKSKGVGVWLWAHWTSVQRQMEDAFSLFEKWGVAGVKVDGMNRDDQWMVDFYQRVAKTAASHRLMIDFDGAYKPDGMSRTWPNLITRGAVMGSEYSKWGARSRPENDVMLAFTRMLAGPMDYGTGGFNSVTPEQFAPREVKPMVLGTRAHQLALYVVFESSLAMVSDSPEAYQGEADFDFIKAVPSTWDETRVMNGRVGEFVTVARQSGRDWYLGGITNGDSRELEIPLEFLGAGTYLAKIYSDDAGGNPKRTAIEVKKVDSGTRLKVKLAPGGGVAIVFLK